MIQIFNESERYYLGGQPTGAGGSPAFRTFTTLNNLMADGPPFSAVNLPTYMPIAYAGPYADLESDGSLLAPLAGWSSTHSRPGPNSKPKSREARSYREL
jgi:hypothetical protein